MTVQRPPARDREAPRRLPGPHQAQRQVPPAPPPLELEAPVRRAQPHRHPSRKVQLGPLPVTRAHADQTRRALSQSRALVEALRHGSMLACRGRRIGARVSPEGAGPDKGGDAIGQPPRGQLARGRHATHPPLSREADPAQRPRHPVASWPSPRPRRRACWPRWARSAIASTTPSPTSPIGQHARGQLATTARAGPRGPRRSNAPRKGSGGGEPDGEAPADARLGEDVASCGSGEAASQGEAEASSRAEAGARAGVGLAVVVGVTDPPDARLEDALAVARAGRPVRRRRR